MSDSVTEKRCTKCEQVKPIDSFEKRNDRGPDTWYTVCKQCTYRQKQQSLSQDPERNLALKQRKQKYGQQYYRQNYPQNYLASKLKIYGIREEEYLTLLDAQGGVCAICGEPETRKHQNGNVLSLSIDHDHKTGKVRGLLCFKCNVRLAVLEDEVFVSGANAYLLQHRQQSAG